MNRRARYPVASNEPYRVLLGLLVVLYGVVAFMGGSHSLRGEYFPVFNWSLFTYVGELRSLGEIRVHRIGDIEFQQPVDYFALDSYFASAKARSADVRKSMDRFIAAYWYGQTHEADRWRRLIEQRHLSGAGQVSYEIVVVEFNPLERWKTGNVRRQMLLGQFETDT